MFEEQQQQQIQQEPIRTSAYQSPMYNYGSSIILMTDPSNDLYKMELSLRGMVLDSQGKPRRVGKPLMNDDGINSILSQTQAIVNQITIMGNLSPRDIPILIEFMGDTIIKDLMVNKLKYEITSLEARDKIHYIALATAFVCMKRAFEEGDRKFWKGSQQEITTRVEGQKQNQGIFSKVLGWAK